MNPHYPILPLSHNRDYIIAFAVVRINGTLVQYTREPFLRTLAKANATLILGQREYYIS
jgi:hypothetical protein